MIIAYVALALAVISLTANIIVFSSLSAIAKDRSEMWEMHADQWSNLSSSHELSQRAHRLALRHEMLIFGHDISEMPELQVSGKNPDDLN